jgi:hypothetical protein
LATSEEDFALTLRSIEEIGGSSSCRRMSGCRLAIHLLGYVSEPEMLKQDCAAYVITCDMVQVSG